MGEDSARRAYVAPHRVMSADGSNGEAAWKFSANFDDSGDTVVSPEFDDIESAIKWARALTDRVLVRGSDTEYCWSEDYQPPSPSSVDTPRTSDADCSNDVRYVRAEAERFRELREQAQLSIEELAAHASVSASVIRNLESSNGEYPKIDTWVKLVRAMDGSVFNEVRPVVGWVARRGTTLEAALMVVKHQSA